MIPQSDTRLRSLARAEARAGRLAKLGMSGLFLAVFLGLIAHTTERSQLMHAYWVAFGFLTTLGLGSLFFTLLHHLVGATWSRDSVRRIEPVVRLLPWCAVLYLPILFWAPETYSATRSFGWFQVRAALYWFIWIALSLFYTHPRFNSPEPATNDTHAGLVHRASGPGMILFAVTITFASFDWFMSLQPHWHSAVFGVYIFAGSVPSALAMLALATLLLERYGVVATHANGSTRHDIGKLLFGFSIFWAYIAFSQYLLIWYANLRSEAPFFQVRFNREWVGSTVLLFTLQFGVPFVALLSAPAKRSPLVLGSVSIVVLAAHAIDFFWLVMPALERSHSHLRFSDVPPTLLMVSAVLLLLARSVERELGRPPQRNDTTRPEPVEPQFKFTG